MREREKGAEMGGVGGRRGKGGEVAAARFGEMVSGAVSCGLEGRGGGREGRTHTQHTHKTATSGSSRGGGCSVGVLT